MSTYTITLSHFTITPGLWSFLRHKENSNVKAFFYLKQWSWPVVLVQQPTKNIYGETGFMVWQTNYFRKHIKCRRHTIYCKETKENIFYHSFIHSTQVWAQLLPISLLLMFSVKINEGCLLETSDSRKGWTVHHGTHLTSLKASFIWFIDCVT